MLWTARLHGATERPLGAGGSKNQNFEKATDFPAKLSDFGFGVKNFDFSDFWSKTWILAILPGVFRKIRCREPFGPNLSSFLSWDHRG